MTEIVMGPARLPVAVICLALLVASPAGLADEPPPPADGTPAPNGVDMNDAERAFSETMKGAVLTGRFTVDGEADAPKEERYEIVSATKTGGSDWIVVARIVYGENDLRVPIPVKIDWAGDTPVLSLTDLTIPGLGTFTSRVMFYGDRYAGTWQHGEKGGHIFGAISDPEEIRRLDAARDAVYDEVLKLYDEFKVAAEAGRDSPEFNTLEQHYRKRIGQMLETLGQPRRGTTADELRRAVLAVSTVIEAFRRPDITPDERKPFVEALENQLSKLKTIYQR